MRRNNFPETGILQASMSGGGIALKRQNKKPRVTLKRWAVANWLALFLLLFVTVVALFATGLLGSVLAFIF